VIFREDLPDRGTLTAKTRRTSDVRENDLSFEKTISTENGNYKIPFEPGNLVHSEEDKTIEGKIRMAKHSL
jgi:hypothetical protein